MQLQFNKSAIRCLETVLQQARNTEVTQELRLPDGMPDIGRVLSTWGQVIIRSKQWLGDTIQMTGGVMIWVLYAPEDGTEPRSVDSWIPFQLNWNVDETKREGPMRMMPVLRTADSRCISSRKLMLRVGVAATVHALSPMEAEIYTPGELPEDIQLLRRSYPLMIPMEGGEKTFLIDEDISMPELGAEPQKLLSLTVVPEITEKKMMSDKIIFKGALILHAVCRYDDGQVRSFELPVQFSQLSDLDHSYGSDARVDIRMAVSSMEADMIQPGTIRLKCGLVAQYLVDERHLLELVQDAYSTSRDVQVEESALQIPVVLDERTELIQVEQSLPAQTGRIVDARFLPDHPIKRQIDNGISLELSGMFQVLCYDDEDILQGTTSRWEGNMRFGVDGTCDPLFSAKPVGKIQVLSSVDGMNLNVQQHISAWIGITEQIPMVSSMTLEQTREPDPSRPSVIVMNGSGEYLWDLAKQNNSTISGIQTANGIDGEIAPERMILIPVL